MRQPFSRGRISSLCIVIAIICVGGAQSAWAGDGGESLTGLNMIISDLCSFLGITTCPQVPTVTQGVLEVAALETSPPEMIRALNNVLPGSTVDAGNPAAMPPTPFPLTVATSPTLPALLSTLTPLAFISPAEKNWNKSGAQKNNTTAAATPLYDPDADNFLYAVASGPSAALSGLTEPDALNLFYDDPSWTNPNLPQSRVAAKFSLPLTVLNNDGTTERSVSAVLQYIPPGRGGLPCSASRVVGDFANTGTPQTRNASDIGVNCALVSAPSPIAPKPHAIFEVRVPLLVTVATDPPYFYTGPSGPINSGIPGAFFTDADGFMPASGVLGANGKYVGIAPSAAPFCPGATCSVPPPPGIFALCASLPQNGYGLSLVPSVAAYYAISTAGETLVSAALPATSTSMCPAL